jgi:hypothetical protein
MTDLPEYLICTSKSTPGNTIQTMFEFHFIQKLEGSYAISIFCVGYCKAYNECCVTSAVQVMPPFKRLLQCVMHSHYTGTLGAINQIKQFVCTMHKALIFIAFVHTRYFQVFVRKSLKQIIIFILCIMSVRGGDLSLIQKAHCPSPVLLMYPYHTITMQNVYCKHRTRNAIILAEKHPPTDQQQ